jgi:protein-tyrosine phosphatase
MGHDMTSAQFDRAVPFPNVSNFRDFGGYETVDGRTLPKGLLYRSAHLSRLDPAGIGLLGSLGIRTIIDLRGKVERTKALPPLDADCGIEILSAPVEPGAPATMLLPDGRTLTGELMRESIMTIYGRFGRDPMLGFGAALRAVLDRLDAPLLIHCTAGKDRTGYTVALVQLILGVPASTVLADYQLTNSLWDRAYEGAGRFPPDVMEPGLLADERYLTSALATLQDEHGDIDTFAARATGIPDYGKRLREKLLDA